MATIVCESCRKTFKTESGRRWHVDHFHQLPHRQDHREISTYEQRDEGADEAEPASPEVLEQPADAMSDRTTETGVPPSPEPD